VPIYANQIAEGEGKFRCRVVIEGWPYIFVDHRSLVRTLSDGREQILGLNPLSVRFSARADLARAQLREQEMTLELFDDDEHRVTKALHRVPAVRTALMSDLHGLVTFITAADTAGFPSSGVVHIGSEAIKYTGKTSTTFTGLTRNHWQSVFQSHFTGDGAKLSFPAITDLPRALHGRRVYIYLYGSGDSSTSDGTLRWRGIVSSDVDYSAGVYRFSVEPLARLLEQPIGGDLEEPVPIRGIYLHAHGGCWKVVLKRGSTADQGTAAATSDIVTITMSGFWNDNADFCAAVNTKIAAATGGWGWSSGAKIRLEPLGTDGYRFVYVTGSSAHWVTVEGGRLDTGEIALSPVDIAGAGAELTLGRWRNRAGEDVSLLLADDEYKIEMLAPVPRGTLGLPSLSTRALEYFRDNDEPANNDGYIYLGGNVVPNLDMMAIVRADGGESDEEEWGVLSEVNTSLRRIRVQSQPLPRALGPQTRVRLLRVIVKFTDIGGLVDAVISGAPSVANTGALPLIVGDDFADSAPVGGSWAELRESIAELGLAWDRIYVTTGGVSLGEMLEHELRLASCYLAIDSSGRLKVRRLGLVLQTDAGAIDLTPSAMKGELPSASMNADGMLREVLVKSGWDPDEKEHKGLTIRVRDVQAPSQLSGVLEIAPRSRYGGYLFSSEDPVEVTVEEAYSLASSLLGLFGDGYEIITVMVALTHFNLELGSTVLLTSPHIPDSDGTMGIENRPAQVIGYDWSPYEGRGQFTLLTHARRIAGYAPALLITDRVDLGSNKWKLVFNGHNAYTPHLISKWYVAGDEVRVIQRNTATPTRLSGVVDTVTDSSPPEMNVIFDSAWTPGSNTWSLGYDRAPNVDTTIPGSRKWAQTGFCYVADSVRRITFASGDVDAYNFAP
jgi:hypothetical protein